MARKLSKNLYNNAYQEKDKGGSSRKSFVDWKKVGGTPKFYTPLEGVNKFNIIPYEIKTKLHPLVRSGKMEVGDLDFMMDVFVHRKMGPNQDTDIICPKKNYGRPCPICDQVSKFYDAGKKDDAKALQASRRVLMNVQPIVHGEPQPLEVFDVSHYLFMKEMLEEAHACANGDDIVPFADIEKGKIIKFRTEEEALGKNKMTVFKSFTFLDRETELDEKIIDKAISFDAGFTMMSAEDIEKILYGQGGDEDETKDPPPKSKQTDEDEPPKKVKPGDEDEEPPAKKKVVDEDDAQVKSSTKCPAGYPWGDADKHPECKKCNIWDDCIEGKRK